MAKKRARKHGVKFDWAGAGRWASRVCSVLVLIGAAAGLTFGVGMLRERASAALSVGSAGGMLEVSFAWPALSGDPGQTWLPERDQEDLILAASRAVREVDPLSSAPLRAISEQLVRTGWFAEPPTVRVIEAGVVGVLGRWRQPGAVVRWGERDYLVSMQAMPMPPVYRAGGSERPVILGVEHGPDAGRVRFDRPWPGLDVRAGLDLLGVLSKAGLLDQVAGVDVAGYRSGGGLEIVTAGGGRIVWGSEPEGWKPGEPGVAERVDRLRKLRERTGRLDGGQRRIEIHRARVEIDLSGG
jgi:hypothetical protein